MSRSSTLALSVLTLLTAVAGPAAAVETESAPGVVGSFNGLALAALVGIVAGIVVFAFSQGGAPDEDDDGHH